MKIENDSPLVSVIIPTYNRSHLVKKAIKSVLQQTYQNLEIIVVDDFSSDSTERIVKSFEDKRIKYFKHSKNLGGSAARNTGIRHSSGEYIAFLDDDDIWLPQKVEKQVNCLESRKNIFIVAYCGHFKIDNLLGFKNIEKRLPKYKHSTEFVKDLFRKRIKLGGSSTLMIKRKYLDRIGGFDESFERHQDWELLIRLLEHGEIMPVKEPLVIKYGDSSPSAKELKKAKIRFFSKFEENIKEYERDIQIDILNAHLYGLIFRYFLEGKFKRGIHGLKKLRGIWILKSILKTLESVIKKQTGSL